MTPITTKKLLADFEHTLGITWSAPADLMGECERLLGGMDGARLLDEEERSRSVLALANWKFRFNAKGFAAFLDHAAERGVYFNYHEKCRIQSYFDRCDHDGMRKWLASRRLVEFAAQFQPIDPAETLSKISEALGLDAKREAILRALFGGYVFCSFAARAMHEQFNADCRGDYRERFDEHLRRFYPEPFQRETAMIALSVTPQEHGYEVLRERIFHATRDAYARLANHCCFAVWLRADGEESNGALWRMYSDTIIFAEKHRETRLKTGYFHPDAVAAQTLAHIPGLDIARARFDCANEGFYFKDCFAIPNAEPRMGESSVPCDLLLLFEKNERDETLIPCPACRSTNVRGNSYPVLGVRSWECQNPFCPERSKYDRGNRYSLQSLMRQEGIEAPENRIPPASLRRWKRDVVIRADGGEIMEMLVRHYTFSGDSAVFWDWPGGREVPSRTLTHESAPRPDEKLAPTFFDSAFFHRFRAERPGEKSEAYVENLSPVSELDFLHGEAFTTLQTFQDESVDGAVTSPPYYNAKSYSSWPNIYCYLHDMRNIAREVFRVLRPGAAFLFNIFDYFDNENIIVFSAMGKKRMILGAYIVRLFEELGFELRGNVVWDKGEIEGKRNFNQGNCSPYYQAPFNCWEHVFVFVKPGGEASANFPTMLRARPVFKMVNGENVLGHSAPFPPEIPELLISRLSAGDTVLDPFAGSFTTCRVAHQRGLRAIGIEYHRDYCDLGLRLFRQKTSQYEMALA